MSSAAWVKALLPFFQKTGRALAASGLINGSSGNLSIRLKDRLVITRHDSILSALTPADLIETGIFEDDSATLMASWELPVHRAVYLATPALAIVHAHPPCTVMLSLLDMPESLKEVAVVGTSSSIVPGALAGEIASELKRRQVVMVKGHGSFAGGKTLEEACALTIKFETECARLCRLRPLAVKEKQE